MWIQESLVTEGVKLYRARLRRYPTSHQNVLIARDDIQDQITPSLSELSALESLGLDPAIVIIRSMAQPG